MVRDLVAAAQGETGQRVTAIADHDEGAAPDQIAAVDDECRRHAPQLPPCPGDGDNGRDARGTPTALEPGAVVHHPRIAAETDVVEKVPIVDDADVDGARTSGAQ